MNRTIVVNLVGIGSGPEQYPLFVHTIITHTPWHSIFHANYLPRRKGLGIGRSLFYKLWTAFSRSVDEATQFFLKSNFDDTVLFEKQLCCAPCPQAGYWVWYVSFNSMNVAALSYLEMKEIEHSVLDCLLIFWTYQ